MDILGPLLKDSPLCLNLPPSNKINLSFLYSIFLSSGSLNFEYNTKYGGNITLMLVGGGGGGGG